VRVFHVQFQREDSDNRHSGGDDTVRCFQSILWDICHFLWGQIGDGLRTAGGK
jgi:hypothetical protein